MMLESNDVKALKQLVADRGAFSKKLEHAHVAPLLLTLVHLGGDPAWLDKLQPYIKGPWCFNEEAPEELKAELRAALVAKLVEYAESGAPLPLDPPADLLPKMLNVAMGQEVPPEYYPVVEEEADFHNCDPKTVHWRHKPDQAVLDKFHVLVIGAGFSGIGMAIKLKQAGIPFTIIEKNPQVGGTWYENSYPGCGVDTANHFYSYSFKNNPNWGRFFASRDEIQDYIVANFREHELEPNVRFKEEVTRAVWDEKAQLWQVDTVTGSGEQRTYRANVVVSAAGQLNRPKMPNIKGLDSFKKPMFHTARWDHEVDIAGKRVGMIGTGASGMQVGPAVAPTVGKLKIFQRSPHWAMHNPLYFETVGDDAKWVFQNVPFYGKWFRFQLFWSSSDGFHSMLHVDPNWPEPERSLNAQNAEVRKRIEAHIAEEVGHDPELIRKAVPDYPPYGKRMLRDNHWYRMLTRPNVDLITAGIDHLEADAVVTQDGQRHEVDVLVLATGFEATRLLSPMHIEGRGGATIRGEWGDEEPRAYLGITVPKFPNFFVMYGPNTNLAHGGSAVYHSECQVRYTMLALREMLEGSLGSLEVREKPFWDYQEKVDTAHSGMVWAHPGVSSWYKNSKGRVTQNSPFRLVDYRNLTHDFLLADYEVDSAPGKGGQGGAS